eukprot:1138604-Pelagomonas_calceolata.AAC.1
MDCVWTKKRRQWVGPQDAKHVSDQRKEVQRDQCSEATRKVSGSHSEALKTIKAAKQEALMGILRVARSTWLQNLAVRIIPVLDNAPSSHCLERLRASLPAHWMPSFWFMFIVTSPTNTQKDGLHAAVVPPITVARVLRLHSIKFQSSVRAAGLHSVGGAV